MKLAYTVLALSLALGARAEDAPRATDADAKAAIDAIAEAVKGGDAEAIKAAIKAAGDCVHQKVAVALQGIVLSSNPDDWREAAATALGRMKGSADAAAALNATLEKVDSNDKVFRAVCAAIEELSHRSSIAALASYAKSRVSRHDKDDLKPIEEAIDALAAISTKASVEAVLDIWQKCKYSGRDPHQNFKERVAAACRKAMRRLTGEKLDNWSDWDDWWEHTRDKLNDDLSRR